MCGEKQIKGFKHDGHMGSPPHVRGKGELSRAGASTSKITPAYAGKSWNSLALKCLLMGSPPRMRGKADGHRKARRRTRITPAYAGKRQPLPGWSKSERDHPRVCGEKTACGLPWLPPWGSPPRMRGKAGSRSASGSACRDHPRVCGEKQRKWMPRICTKGSPPRMRGKGIEQSNCRVGMRITPAYAGKRLKRSRSTVSPVAIVPLFPSVCNKLVVSDGSPAGRDAPLFLPAENAVPASPAYNLRSL